MRRSTIRSCWSRLSSKTLISAATTIAAARSDREGAGSGVGDAEAVAASSSRVRRQQAVVEAGSKLVFWLAAMSLNFLLGFTGVLSFGHAAYFGLGAYGVAAASLLYFDKSVHELTIAEAAYLAVLPKAPANYDPVRAT